MRSQRFLQHIIMKRTFFLLAIVATLFVACDEKNKPEENGDNNATSSSITCDPTSKTVSTAGDSFVVTIKSNAAWSASANQSWVTIDPKTGQGDAFVTITVAAGDAGTAQVLFTNGDNTATLTIQRGNSPTPPTPPTGDGVLSGEFSVSATTKVHFSKGNLQYVGTWQFATNQWDYFGTSQSDNHRDLFGWGTGNNPNNVSTDYDDYATYIEWGNNPITNGGNKANQWRTLSKDEWVYLFYGRTDAATKFGLGSVNGVNGTILLPDNWTLPGGVSFNAGTTKGLVWTEDRYYYDSNGGQHFADNTYTAAQWKAMEDNGAVFLPAAGHRYGSDVLGVGSYGDYWSSTPNEYSACFLFFYSDYLNPQSYLNRVDGRSVRLVR